MAYELQKEQAEIDQNIANELVILTPEWWSAAILEVEATVHEQNTSLNVTVESPEGHSDVIEPSSEIYISVTDLYTLFKRHGHMWKKVKYTITLQPDNEWRFEADFSY